MVEGSLMYAVKGLDSNNTNYGGNVFTDFQTPRTKNFDNFIGQGVRTTIIIGGIRTTYLISPITNLRLEVGINVRSGVSDLYQTNSTLFTIGLKSNLNNNYHDF